MKRIVLFLAAALLAMMCAAEGVYDTIGMGFTMEDFAPFGALVPVEGYYCVDDALVSFYESGRLNAKCRLFNDVADVAAETDGAFDLVRKLKQGASLDRVTEILGEGAEIMVINIADEDNPGMRKVLAWKDKQGGVLEALFEMDNGGWVLFALTEP